VKSYPKDLLPNDSRNLILTPIIRNILDQKNSVSEIREMLASVEQTEEIASITADLQQLEQVYSNLNIEEQIRNNRADLLLSDANLVEITAIVERIRNRITA
jgi:DNA-binding transcriptional MerR regulator